MKFITLPSAKIKRSENNTTGFTLIELIIVIGVLGVLAAALLIAINPVEQLARGRDAGRISSVTQLARAMQAYLAAQGTAAYPAASNVWQNTLVTSGDIKGAIIANPGATNPCIAADNQGDFCYTPFAPATDGAVWIQVNSLANISKVPAAQVTACGGATAFYAVAYVFSQGRAGITCTTGPTVAPTAGSVLN